MEAVQLQRPYKNLMAQNTNMDRLLILFVKKKRDFLVKLAKLIIFFFFFFKDVSSGSSADWTFDELKIFFSYGVELRDDGTYGFLLPEDQILPTAMETFEGLKALAFYIKSDPFKNSSSSSFLFFSSLATKWLILIQLFFTFKFVLQNPNPDDKIFFIFFLLFINGK